MAQRKAGRQAAAAGTDSIFDLGLDPWIAGGSSGAKAKGGGKTAGAIVYVGHGQSVAEAIAAVAPDTPAWLAERAAKKRGEPVLVPGANGPVWIVQPLPRPSDGSHGGLLDASPYAQARDAMAPVMTALADHGLATVAVSLRANDSDERKGALVGLELGGYRYRNVRQAASVPQRPAIEVKGAQGTEIADASALAGSTNLARHFVNVPAGELNTKTFSEAVTALFSGSKHMDVDVWDPKRVTKEGLGLMAAVGQGAVEGPRLVHLRYRPKGKGRAGKPLAFVGKGITFDTGGLDIKDAASMRLMKKDMGGAASVAAIAYWVDRAGLDLACDFYLALAENSVDERSFRPGDVLRSRAGQTVEIDNTDAEGRLVLADAINVALTQKGPDQPGWLIDLATLTGAMRIGLGTRVAGLFANDDRLADQLLAAGQRRGDPVWRMPLVAEYMMQLKSSVADVANSGPGRFGGAITAALFLQRFVGKTPWAHIDLYAWTEAGGSFQEPGGNGQCVQGIADALSRFDA